LLTALCEATGDEEQADRLRAVSSSFERQAAGEPVAAWRILHELMGEAGARKLANLLDIVPVKPTEPTVANSLNADDDLNDAGNARRLVAAAGGVFIYVPELESFFRYCDNRWVRDSDQLDANLCERV
jgi:hypothetical protein